MYNKFTTFPVNSGAVGENTSLTGASYKPCENPHLQNNLWVLPDKLLKVGNAEWYIVLKICKVHILVLLLEHVSNGSG